MVFEPQIWLFDENFPTIFGRPKFSGGGGGLPLAPPPCDDATVAVYMSRNMGVHRSLLLPHTTQLQCGPVSTQLHVLSSPVSSVQQRHVRQHRRLLRRRSLLLHAVQLRRICRQRPVLHHGTHTVTQYFNKEFDKRTNSKERNKKRNGSNVKKTLKNQITT